MIAALPMYDRPETAEANDRLWQGIRKYLGYGPARLTRGRDVWEVWESPDLLLGQTCGLPYRARLFGNVTLVGTPDYRLGGCPPGYYRSAIVMRADDPRSSLEDLAAGTLAYSDPMSQSGWAAPQAHLAARGLRPAKLVETGSHDASARAVAAGRADYAAIDAVSWAMIARWDDFATDLRVLEETKPTPGLPFITAHGTEAPALFSAIDKAISAMSPSDRDILLLDGLVEIAPETYRALALPPPP